MARPLPPASRGRTVTPSPHSWPIWWPSNWATRRLEPERKAITAFLARIYGAVVLLDGYYADYGDFILYTVREILDGHVHVDAMKALTFILSAIHAVVLVVSAART